MVKKIKNQNTDKKKVHNLSEKGTINEHFLKKKRRANKKSNLPYIIQSKLQKK